MIAKPTSYFLVGLITGLLLAVGGMSYYIRHHMAHGTAVRALKLAHALDASHPVHLGMVYMAERLAEKSGGAMQIQVFPGGVLGSETENLEQIQRGALDLTKVSTAAIENFIPEMGVFGLPYVFRDAEHFWRVLNGDLGRELLDLGMSYGLKGLCYYDAGSRSIYTTTRPVRAPTDLRGQKIRVVQSRMAMDMIQMMGAAPTPISWGELYTSLQQGVVDGAENNPPSFYTSRHYEVCRYYTLNEHTRIPDMLVISLRAWDRLSEEEQRWIEEAAQESSAYQRALWEERTRKALDAVRAHGVEIIEPDLAPFVEIVQPLMDRQQGTRIGEWVDRIRTAP